MEIYGWWELTSDEILACPDKQKVIRTLVKNECLLRDILGYKKLPQEQVNKLIALMEVKYLLNQKSYTDTSANILDSIHKCNLEINKIREGPQDVLEISQEKDFMFKENIEIDEILNITVYTNPIINKLLS